MGSSPFLNLRILGMAALTGLMIGLQGCANHYGPPMFGKQNTYMTKPRFDSGEVNTQRYGGLELASSTGYNSLENTYSLMPSYHQAHAFAFFDVAYGAFGYIGRYKVNNIPEENGGKLFTGLGARASANFNLRFDDFNWRIIGFEGAYSREFGAYRQMRADFNQGSSGDSLFMYHTQGHSASFGFFTEFLFRSDSDVDFWSLKLAAGAHPGFGNNNNPYRSQGEDGMYIRIATNKRLEPFVITGSYFLTVGYSSEVFRNGFTLSAQVPLEAVFNKEKP